MDANGTENLTYETASKELEAIINELKKNEITIDQLAGKVERAALLAAFCTEKLRNTEDRINKTMKENGL